MSEHKGRTLFVMRVWAIRSRQDFAWYLRTENGTEFWSPVSERAQQFQTKDEKQ